MMHFLLAADSISGWQLFVQQCINGLTFGALVALVALGYTMVYGIIGLINFAHGDLFMLGWMFALGLVAILMICAAFCAVLNWSVDRVVYKPLRRAPKLAPLVSAIGVSFVFMNVGRFWGGAAHQDFPDL